MYIQINVQFISALEQSSIHDMTEDFQNKNTVLYSVFTKILKNNQNKVFEYVYKSNHAYYCKMKKAEMSATFIRLDIQQMTIANIRNPQKK